MTIFINISPGKGRGVFAAKDFKAGEVIEVCPVIPVPLTQTDVLDKTILSDYVFEWGEKKDELALCLGYGSIYNHSDDPNAEFDNDLVSSTIVFKALRDISKGEEICTDYGWDHEGLPVWFKSAKSEPRPEV